MKKYFTTLLTFSALVFGPFQVFAKNAIEEADFSVIDSLELPPTPDYALLAKLAKDEELKKERVVPDAYLAVLKKGSRIYDLETGKDYNIVRNVVVYARDKQHLGDTTYIFTKKGKLAYKTFNENVSKVTREFDLLPKVQKYQEYEPQITEDNPDTKLKLTHRLHYYFESVDVSYLNSVFQETEETTDASASRVEYELMYQTRFPIQVSLNLGLQQGVWNTSTTESKWSQFLIGSKMGYLLKTEKYDIVPYVGLYQSSGFRLVRGTTSFQFEANTLQLGSQITYEGDWGLWSVGLAYNESKPSLKAGVSLNDNNEPREKIKSFGLVFSYGFETIL